MNWGAAHWRSFPWRTTNDPFRILVAEVMLQRSRGITVAKVYERFFGRWPDAQSVARAHVRSIGSVIRPLGLTGRAATLKALAREVTERGSVPDSFEELLSLPGVGPYAAGATLVVAFGKRAPVVDGVTARVYRRYFGLGSNGAANSDGALWSLVEEVTPKGRVREWNWAVLDLAATVCLPKVPRCSECPLALHCAWSQVYGSSLSSKGARIPAGTTSL